VNGKLLHEIPFKEGVPVLDKFVLPGNTATIVLTGDHDTDIRHATEAWRNLNPGQKLPEKATFHHDLLNATEETAIINGKKTKVIVGKMQLVPRDVNKAVFHQGSASVATKYYQGLGIDVAGVARLAKEEARLAGKSGTIAARGLKKIKPGRIAKGLTPLVGRSVIRLIPLATTGLAVLEFAENAEAHGIGGAIARATPVLGDLISAHDLGSDLAKQIRDETDAAAAQFLSQLNKPSRDAWEEADRQTIDAFNELAPQIRVTNPPRSDGGGSLVDPRDVADALHEYHHAMQHSNYKWNSGMRNNFNSEAKQHKQRLRERLERASQKNAPTPPGRLG
jgi:hypothetical protein